MIDVLERINELRKSQGWSIYKLSEESGVSQSTLSNMFVRGTNPSISTLSTICEALGVTLSEFFAEDTKEFNVEELKLLSNYRKLKPQEKNIINSVIETTLNKRSKSV